MDIDYEFLERDMRSAFGDFLDHLFAEKLPDIWHEAIDHRPRVLSKSVIACVVPLDRIGAPAGSSGSRVFIAYFAHRANILSIPPSLPLVLKIRRYKDMSGIKKLELKDEYDQSQKFPKLYDKSRERFATPICCATFGDFEFLAAPFSSKFRHKGNRLDFASSDLWSKLNEKPLSSPEEELATDISYTLRLVEKMHRASRNGSRRKKLSYWEQYNWYLRKTTLPEDEPGSRQPQAIALFGNGTNCEFFGMSWPNPRLLIERILSLDTFKGVTGYVHGDLHPKNVVFGSEKQPNIIDFGWAHEDRHIVVDYLLLDVNLRSVTLPAAASESEILALAQFLASEDSVPKLGQLMSSRATVLKQVVWDSCLRSKAADKKSWCSDYLIPLLLVSYGLLVHLKDARNQRSLIATIVCLADRISKELDSVA